MTLEDCEIPSELRLTEDDAGFKVMLEIALPPFNLGAAAVALGLCRAAVAHLKSARFEHLGQSLGESLPTLRAQLAAMQIDTDGLAAAHRRPRRSPRAARAGDDHTARARNQGGRGRGGNRRHLGGGAGMRGRHSPGT